MTSNDLLQSFLSIVRLLKATHKTTSIWCKLTPNPRNKDNSERKLHSLDIWPRYALQHPHKKAYLGSQCLFCCCAE